MELLVVVAVEVNWDFEVVVVEWIMELDWRVVAVEMVVK